MNIVQPVRDLQKLEAMKAVLRRKSYRDYIMFIVGCNTALRVGDLLRLTVGDVRGKDHITGHDEKTGKPYRHKLPASVRTEIAEYITGMDDLLPLFPSRRGSKAITRVQAWRILSDAASEVSLDDIGTHSLRKTFGYQYVKATGRKDIAQKVFNQSDGKTTERYLGLTDDDVDEALGEFEL